MDRLRILKEFQKLALGDVLEIDEIKLYLLLLAYSRVAKYGEITYGTVKGAFGEELSLFRFRQVCCQLTRHNLVEIVSPPLDKISGNDFILRYRIFPCREKQEN